MSEPRPQPALLTHLLAGIAPLRAIAQSEHALRRMAAGVGWDLDQIAGLDIGAVLHNLGPLVTDVDTVIAHLVNPPSSLPDYIDLLRAIGDGFDRGRRIGNLLDSRTGTPLDQLGRDLVPALIIAGWSRTSPMSLLVAAILGIVEIPAEDGPSPAVVDGTTMVRRPWPHVKVRGDRLGDLLRDPRGTLREVYFGPGGLDSRDAARRGAEKLFPRIAALCQQLGISAMYGPPEGTQLTGDPEVIEDLIRTLTIIGFQADGASFGATLALSGEPATRGLIVQPFGTIELAHDVEPWRFALEVTESLDGIRIGDDLEFVGGSALRATLAATRIAELVAPATKLGGATGTGLTLGTARFEGSVALAGDAREVSILAAVDHAKLQVASGDGDGFLQRVLPADGMNGELDLAIGWSSTRGLFFRGSAGLEASWPVHAAIGPVTLDAIHLRIAAGAGGVELAASIDAELAIGPVAVRVDQVGLAATLSFPPDGGNLGAAHLDLGWKPPGGLGLAIDTAGVTGRGELVFEPGRYIGGLGLAVRDLVAIDLVGLLETRKPDGSDGFSLVLAGVATFPPIPIGFGFELHGAGALLGIHRRIDQAALAAALAGGHLEGLLSPPPHDVSPVQVATQLATVLPYADSGVVGGVSLLLGWGHPTLADIALAFLYDTSHPDRLIAIGTVSIELPRAAPLLELHVDVLGVFAVAPLWIDVRASLRDSSLAGMTLTGDAALQLGLGDHPRFLLAIGGFHPAFTPPDDFPALRRIQLALPPNDFVQLSLQGYFAVTASSLQLGAALHFWAGIDGLLGVTGDASFDALITFRPLHFDAALKVDVSVEVAGHRLFGARIRGHLTGPGPWRVDGGVYIDVAWWEVEVYSVHATFGGADSAPALPAVDIASEVAAALAVARNWRAVPVDARALVVRPDLVDDGRIAVHPLATLEVTQSVAPLAVTIDHVGGAPVAGARSIALTAPRFGTALASSAPLPGFFAPAQFFALDDAAKLSRPSFESMTAGMRIEPPAPAAASDPTAFAIGATLGYETIPHPPDPARYHLPPEILGAAIAATAPASAAPRPVVLQPVRYAIASSDTMATDAAQTPAGGFASRAEAAQALRDRFGADATDFQIVEHAA